MNFLYFIADNKSEFQTLIHNIIAKSTYESRYISEKEKWFIKANNIKKASAKKSYFEYSHMDINMSPDAKYWLESEQYSTVKNTLPSPILHDFDYYMTYAIELFLNDLVDSLSKMSFQNEIYFVDELSDYFLTLNDFSEKWKQNKMFFWKEN